MGEPLDSSVLPSGSTPTGDPPRALYRKLGVFVLLSVGFAALGTLTPLRGLWSGGDGLAIVRGVGAWGPLLVIVAGALAPFALLPRWPIAVGCGLLYGLGWGSLLANCASTLGAWLQFRFARRSLSPAAARLLARYGRRLAELPPRRAFALLVVLRVFPLSNFVATNLLAASLDLSPRAYLLGTFVGMVPSTLMYGAWGRMAAHPTGVSYAVAAALLVLVAVIAWLAQRRLSSVLPPDGSARSAQEGRP